jgi:hypothetical protein
MMILDLPSGKIGVMFKHRMFKKPVLDKRTCDKFMNGLTHCEVYRLTLTPVMDATLIATGVGICKWPDAFCKALGRKASLTSVLRKRWGTPEHGFSREDRILIWDAYWKYTQPPARQSTETINDPSVALMVIEANVVDRPT